MKRLAIFLDGTWDRPSVHTNVSRLRHVVAPVDGAGVVQQATYLAGVGTRRRERLLGGLLGVGLDRNVQKAYSWLVRHYEDGDEVYVFGFSRGAYTARSLAGMIARCGLLAPGSATTVPEVFARYADKDRHLAPGARRIDIHFLGVWDTVGALGVPFGRIRQLSRSTTLFHNTNPSARYKNMFHALAVDENRFAYAPTLWTAFQPAGAALRPLNPDQKLEQRWFVGAHTDVGGGPANPSLAAVPLLWISERAAECGLALSAPITLSGTEGGLAVYDSFARFLWGMYRVLRLNRRFYRPIGRGSTRTAGGRGYSHPLNETIDGTVFDRWRADDAYRPAGLVRWAQHHRLDPATLHGTVEAHPGAHEAATPVVDAARTVDAAHVATHR